MLVISKICIFIRVTEICTRDCPMLDQVSSFTSPKFVYYNFEVGKYFKDGGHPKIKDTRKTQMQVYYEYWFWYGCAITLGVSMYHRLNIKFYYIGF